MTKTLSEITSGKADAITKRRFDRAFHHILNNAAFEEPVLAIRIAAGCLSILDGNHRMAAFCGLQTMEDERFEKLGLEETGAGTRCVGRNEVAERHCLIKEIILHCREGT